jgi:ABC-type bacteriocin/lantibiotic exporter with double-glycine peptidase domain
MLSYSFSWLPVLAVISVRVLLSTYLALIALAVMAVLTLALVVALIWLAATNLYALAIAALAKPRADRTQRQHRGRLPV